MKETSLSLLGLLCQAPQEEAWDRLAELYTPLLRAWLRKVGVQDSDADDLLQEVLTAVWKDLPRFTHSGRPGTFRAWLRAILVNRLRNFWRGRRRPEARGGSEGGARLEQLEDPDGALARGWDREHDEHIARQLLARAEPHFTPTTWEAFRRVVLAGARPDAVAAELGLSVNAVFIAKSRVLARLRQEADGLIPSSSRFLAGD